MKLTFHTLDVFTARKFGGNPLAVVLGADALTTEQMQSICREFNLSETSFVMAPEDPAHTAKVRIFFPGGEMPFAGHPTLGTAALLASLKHKAGCSFETTITRLRELRETPSDTSLPLERYHTALPPAVICVYRAVAASLQLRLWPPGELEVVALRY